MRMHRVVALVAGACAAVTLLAGCTGPAESVAEPTAVPSSRPTPTPTPTPTAAAVTVPKKAKGELSRTVLVTSTNTLATTLEQKSRPGKLYAAYAACQAPNPTEKASFEIRVGGKVTTTVTFPCDGSTAGANALARKTSASWQISMPTVPSDAIAAYAVLVPEGVTSY